MTNFFRYSNSGKPAFAPKFKKKGKKDAFRYPQGVKVRQSRVYLPKIGWVRYRASRPIEGTILQATIKREGPHWFVCLACEVNLTDVDPIPVSDEKAVGIDVGLKTFATLSDGTEIENPKFLRVAQRQLSKA
ncbi:MAG: transposase, partial [Verrucomicrobiaceae bacterium]